MKLLNLSRRRFLQASAAVGSTGLLIGCSGEPEKALPNPSQEPEAEMHEWLYIGTDNKIIMTNPQTEMGQGVNTSLPQILAEELDADWHTLEVRQAPLNSKFENAMGMQLTAGSMAVKDFFDILRTVGAGARLMILKAAAAQLNTDINQLSTNNAHVIYQGKTYPYGQFVTAAANLAAPEAATISFKPADQYQLIGKPLTHRDTYSRITGQATYGIDVQVPGMLNAAIVQAPIFGSKPMQWDEQAALAIAGVKKVIPIDNALIVVADKYWQAQKGVNALKASFSDYQQEVPGRSQAEIIQAYNHALDEQGKANVSAPHVLDLEYTGPFLAHATMEPMNATAWVRDDRVDLWIPHQGQTAAAAYTRAVTGLEDEQIHIHNVLMGGGFGRRSEGDFVAQAVLASMAMGAPVKLIWSREQDIQHDVYRPMVISRFQIGLDDNYQPIFWHNQFASSSVMRRIMQVMVPNFLDWAIKPATSFIGDSIVAEGASHIAYLPADTEPEISQLLVDTNIPLGSWRAVGHSTSCFFTESIIDEIAHKAEKDPYQFRSQLMSHLPREQAVLDRVATLANWGKPESGRFQGIAVEYAFKSYAAMVVEISVSDKAIRVHKVTCVVDCGRVINPNGAIGQIEGGINFGLSAAMQGEITIEEGRVQQSNFHDYPLMRLAQSPVIEVELVTSEEAPTGLGEVGVPPLAPALCNALFAATGERLRSLPLTRHGFHFA
jgi:isoquinoline 1-oxidoreductase beta subunit